MRCFVTPVNLQSSRKGVYIAQLTQVALCPGSNIKTNDVMKHCTVCTAPQVNTNDVSPLRQFAPGHLTFPAYSVKTHMIIYRCIILTTGHRTIFQCGVHSALFRDTQTNRFEFTPETVVCPVLVAQVGRKTVPNMWPSDSETLLSLNMLCVRLCVERYTIYRWKSVAAIEDLRRPNVCRRQGTEVLGQTKTSRQNVLVCSQHVSGHEARATAAKPARYDRIVRLQ